MSAQRTRVRPAGTALRNCAAQAICRPSAHPIVLAVGHERDRTYRPWFKALARPAQVTGQWCCWAHQGAMANLSFIRLRHVHGTTEAPALHLDGHRQGGLS